MTVPYTFAASSGSIPLSYLDSNFATTITMGNTAVQLGDTITTFNNVTLASPTITAPNMSAVTISSGNATVTSLTATTGTFSGNVQMASLNGGAVSLRNKIINGSFTVNQRGITTVTPASGDYTADRWAVGASVASKFSISISTAGSTGVAAGISGGALTATSLSPYTVGGSETFNVQQRIEGYNIADLAWGTAAAKTVTLSFYVQSSLTGTFGGSIRNNAQTRSYPFTYSILATSTWTRISVTIPGDTTGAFSDWLTTTGLGLSVIFSLGTGATLSGTAGSWAGTNYNSATGAVSVVGPNAATWLVANVQLEVGPVATPFEQRPIGMELLLCQRYYYRLSFDATVSAPFASSGFVETTTTAYASTPFPVTMRIAPTAVEQSGTAANYVVRGGGQTVTCSSVPTYQNTHPWGGRVILTTAAVLTVGQAIMGQFTAGAGYIGWSAEL